MNKRNQVIDVHCHLFFLDYVLKELLEIASAIEKNKYPLDMELLNNIIKGLMNEEDFKINLGAEEREYLEGFKDDITNFSKGLEMGNEIIEFVENPGDRIMTFSVTLLLEWIFSFYKDYGHYFTLLKKLGIMRYWESEFFDLYQDNAKKHWKTDQEVILAPLMMDVYYMIAKPAKLNFEKNDRTSGNDFSLDLDSIAGNLTNFAEKSISDINKNLEDPGKMVSNLLDFSGSDNRREPLCFKTDGFEHQRKAILNLKKEKPGLVYPFFAVDPRRENIAKEVFECVGPGKDFHGIKLYPRLGYHPGCSVLMEIYGYAESQNIPIIYHSSIGGFPPEKIGSFPWPHGEFSSPLLWKPILEKHNKLKLCFAHFSNGSDEWRNYIVDLMKDYPNVYADFSCFISKEQAEAARDIYHQHKEILQERMLYGTDFNIIMALGHWLGDYMKLWPLEDGEYFNAEDMEKLTVFNPSKYLGIV